MTDSPSSRQAGVTDSRNAVAVLGITLVGSAMARRLAAAGLRTTVWDRSPAGDRAARRRGRAGSRVSTGRCRPRAGVVITMLPTAEVAEQVIFAGGGAEAFADGAVWAQMGTIGVAATTGIAGPAERAASRCAVRGRAGIGSKGPAESGQLLILASGPAAAEAVVSSVRSHRPQDRVAG